MKTNLLMGFVFCFTLAYLLISIKINETPPTPPREGAYVIEMNWNDGVDADLDLWVKAPNGEAVGFNSRDSGTMSLLRDDLGNTADVMIKDDGTVGINPLNREETTIRAPLPGTYTVNVHYYGKPVEGPIKVIARVMLKDSSDGKILLTRELHMEYMGDEKTAFKFELDETGKKLKSFDYPTTPDFWVVTRPVVGARE